MGQRGGFSVVMPDTFEYIRAKYGPQSLKDEYKLGHWQEEDAGKSESKFIVPSRGATRLKVEIRENADIQDILQRYVSQIVSEGQNVQMLCRLVGVFQYRHGSMGETCLGLLYENLNPEREEGLQMYDLKGLDDRSQTSRISNSKFEKEFKEDYPEGIKLTSTRRNEILNSLNAAHEFLEQANVSDYSILLQVPQDSDGVRMKIIDYFEQYNAARRAEVISQHRIRL